MHMRQDEKLHTPSSSECADLANCGSGAVELASHGGGSRLGGKETKTVARTEFTKAQENTVNHSESGDVLLQLNVEAAHDEAKDCLQEQPGDLFIKNVTSKATSTGERKRTMVYFGPR